MSTSIYVFGQLTMPEGREGDLRASKLAPLDGESFFGRPFERWDVKHFLDSAEQYGLGVLFITFDGDEVKIRAALGEDLLTEWAGSIGAFVRAAAALGARGEVFAVERSGDFGHRLVADGKRTKETAIPKGARVNALLATPAAMEVSELLESAGERRGGKAPSGNKAAAAATPAKEPSGKKAAAAMAPQAMPPPGVPVHARTIPPGVLAARTLTDNPKETASYVAAATGQSNSMNRNVAAEALVRAGGPAELEAVAGQLDGADWRGGPFAHLSVAALFRLDPEKAFDRLKPFLAAQKKAPGSPSMPVLHAFELLVMGPVALAVPGLDVPRDLVARDPRWLDLAGELEGASFAALKGLPKKLLSANKALRAKAPKKAAKR